MRPRDGILRVKRFEAEEKARKVSDIESMIRELEGMAADLGRQIASEEEKTGVKDPAHFAYSTFAKATAQRRDNLLNSAVGLREKLAAAMQERDLALETLAKLEQSEPRDPRLRLRGHGDANSLNK